MSSGLGTSEAESERDDRRRDRKIAAAGGLIAATIGFGGMSIVGTATAYEARRLVDAILPTARFAASSYITGGASILALMLALLTFSISHDLEFRTTHFKRIQDLATMTVAVIVGSVILLMFLGFPIDEADVDRGWYLWVYYGLLLGNATTGGVFISVVLMLFSTIKELVAVAMDPGASSLVDTD